ncbi:MAG: type 4a pilus biogenesis protein PilO [Deltaproteobacteria bacterium]|nr:type 4a pilus biogenesis protein PilO [Deltaproteobacteria bacterium]
MDELIQRIAKVPLAQRLLALAICVALLPAGTYFIWITDVEANIVRQNSQINTLDTQLVQKKAIARDLTRYRVEVERLKQRLNEALTLLPNDAEIPELLQKIAALVEQSDCTMSRFAPTKEIRSGFYARIPVDMAVTGSYHSIAVFFDKVAKLARIVNVTDINLSNPVQVNKKVMLKAKFTATTFKFIEQASAPAGDSPKRRRKGGGG